MKVVGIISDTHGLVRPEAKEALMGVDALVHAGDIGNPEVLEELSDIAPLTAIDRLLLGFWSLFLSPHHIQRAAVILKPTTLFKFHDILQKRKYRLLYTAHSKGKPGPKGPSQELIAAIVEMRKPNSRFGCPRIAQEINQAFGVGIDKDVVRRVPEKHHQPGPDSGHGPSWLTFIGHMKDSLWSTDIFRCESILLNTHWVLVVMDPFTRRIIGFVVHDGDVDCVALCRMFNTAIAA